MPEGLCPACLADALVEAPVGPRGSPELAPGEDLEGLRYFGDYELLAEINRGGMGIVYKARQLGVNRVVALKVLIGGAAAGHGFVHRFHTEAAAAARLDHPHIVPVYEFGTHEGAHFLTMRFMEGGTLLERLKSGAVAPREAARLMILIAGAVQQAHQRGVLHRDLKPGNILLDETGEPHVADFGLARLAELEEGVTLTSAILGTAAYMPPEQATGAVATTAGDIYGLGAVLYELLTGQPPFTGSSIPEILRKVQEEEPALPLPRKSTILNPQCQIPNQAKSRKLGIWGLALRIGDLQTICLKCLEKDPARRYATAQDLADDLQRFLDDEPILARPISSTARFWRWCRRRPAIAALSVALLFALLGGFAGTLWQLNEAQQNAAEKRRHIARLSLLNGINLMQDGDHFRSLLWFADALAQTDPTAEFTDIDRLRIASIIDQDPKLVAVITYDGEPVADAAFDPVQDRLATVGRDRRLRLWSIPSGELISMTDPFDEPPSDVQFSPKGDRLLLTSTEYNHATILPISAHLDVGGSPSDSPDRTSNIEHRTPNAEVNPNLGVGRSALDVGRSPLPIPLIPHLTAGANNLPLLPRFAPTGDHLLVQTAPQTLRVYSALDASPLGPEIPFAAPIAWMTFTDDANAILALTQDGRFSTWDWTTGTQLDVRSWTLDVGSSNRTSNVELSTSNIERSGPLDVRRSTLDVQRSPYSPRYFSPDQTKFASLSPDLRIQVRRTDDETPISPPIHHNPATGPVEFSATGRYLFTLHPAYAVFVWDLEDRGDPPVLLRPGAPRTLVETGRDGRVTVTRDPNSPIRVRGLSGPNEISLHPSSLKEPPVQAWFDQTGRFIILEYPSQRAQVWDTATGLPVTPIFQSRYATSEAEYRTVHLPQSPNPKSPIPNPQSSIPNRSQTKDIRALMTDHRSPITDYRVQAELLSGSRLDGTGGWKPLELGEIVALWSDLSSSREPTPTPPKTNRE